MIEKAESSGWKRTVFELIKQYLPGATVSEMVTTKGVVRVNVAPRGARNRIQLTSDIESLEKGDFLSFETVLDSYAQREAQEAVTSIVEARKEPKGAAQLCYNVELRDMFAAAALASQFLQVNTPNQSAEEDRKEEARICYEMADIMLAARGK